MAALAVITGARIAHIGTGPAVPTRPVPAVTDAPARVDLTSDLLARVPHRRSAPVAAPRSAPAQQPLAPAGADRPTTHPSRSRPRHPAPAAVVQTGSAPAAARWAVEHVGVPYRYGAAGPDGYDCSGLVVAAYAHVGIRLPHSTTGLARAGRPVTRDQLRPGDIVLPIPGHAQIYLGDGLVVEAAHTGTTVRIRALWGFWTARRIT